MIDFVYEDLLHPLVMHTFQLNESLELSFLYQQLFPSSLQQYVTSLKTQYVYMTAK